MHSPKSIRIETSLFMEDFKCSTFNEGKSQEFLTSGRKECEIAMPNVGVLINLDHL